MNKSIFLLIPISIFILLSCSSNTNYEQRMVYDVNSYADELDLAPSADQIAYLSDSYMGVTWGQQFNSLHIFHIGTGVDEEIREVGFRYYLYSPKFSPDGRTIAVCGRRYKGNVEAYYGIYLYDLQAKDGFKVIYTGYVGYLDWTPDSEWIVFTESETYYKTDIYKIHRDGSEKTLIWDNTRIGSGNNINGLNLSYDGKYMVVGLDSDENGYSILLLNSDGTGEPKVLVSSSRGGMYPHFDTDDSKVLYYTYTGGENHYIEHVNIDDCDYERIVEGYGPTTMLGCKYIYFERNGDIWEMRIY